MSADQDLINKLLISKKIMERHDSMGRGNHANVSIPNTPVVEDYKPVSGNYNIPQDLLSEVEVPTQKNYNTSVPTADRIASSKLPDEIKRLMMEHPIQQPNNPLTGGSSLSPDLIDKASRLMNTKANGEPIIENVKPKQQPTQSSISFNPNQIKDIVRETVEDVLRENGLMVESTKKSNEVFRFKVGQHIFEGKITKIKKVSE